MYQYATDNNVSAVIFINMLPLPYFHFKEIKKVDITYINYGSRFKAIQPENPKQETSEAGLKQHLDSSTVLLTIVNLN